jgi:hypothetical protein
MKEIFRRLAEKAAQAVGSYLAFLLALLTTVMWAVTGLYFRYSDTWQLFHQHWHDGRYFLDGLSHPKTPRTERQVLSL